MPLEQISTAITFYAYFSESKVGKTGLTVTIDIWEDDGTPSEIITAGSATEMGDGLYYYTLASGSVDAEGAYIAVFKTATTTVDQQHIPAIWLIQKAGIENLNATVSSRASQTTLDTLDDLVDTEITDIRNRLPAALVSGRIDASVGAMAAGTVTATAIATDAIDDDAIATGAITSTAFAAGAITASAIAADAIGASELAADAVTEIAAAIPTAAANAAAVWDRDATAHQTQGTFGQAIGDPVADTNTLFKAVVTDATAATVGLDVVAVKAETASIQADTDSLQTDITTLLSRLSALRAGYLDNLSAGAVATQASLNTLDDYVDTEVASILADTTTILSRLSAARAGYLDNLSAGAVATQASVNTLDDFVDTEVAAIKAKTDQLTFTTANKIDATIQAAGDFAQGAADKVWDTTIRTLSAAGVQAIWDALTSALTTVGSIGKLLVTNIATLGTGDTAFIYTLTYNSAPIANANIYITSDVNGLTKVAEGVTNNNGVFTAFLDAGTYYVWRQKVGWSFANPDVEVHP